MRFRLLTDETGMTLAQQQSLQDLADSPTQALSRPHSGTSYCVPYLQDQGQ